MDPWTAPPEELLSRLSASGLRGRGGAWFPAAQKWRAVRAESGAAFVAGNGAEGEPGSVKDRHLLLTRPQDVVRGLLLACRTVGAREAAIYLKGALGSAAAGLRDALAQAPPHDVDVRIVIGEDTYVAGEETALLEGLEGRPALPREKPPWPSGVGYQGRPTLVQNVETLARVEGALRDPAATAAADRTLVSIWGHVARPGVHDVALGTPVRDVIGLAGADDIGLVFPAGPSAPPLHADEMGTLLHPDALRERGSGLGTAALLVLRAGTCPISALLSAARFLESASCGQCPPCTLGTQSLARVLQALEDGGARAKQIADIGEVASFMAGHGWCGHARTAAAAIGSVHARFPAAVEQHLARGCPGGRVDPFAAGSAERTAIEATASTAVA